MKFNKGKRKAALHKVTEHLTEEFRAKQEVKSPEKVIIEIISYNEESIFIAENKPLDEL